MATTEQPLKKRRVYESPVGETPGKVAGGAASPGTPPILSPEEVLRRRRNREEIRSLYESYRRIRSCVSHEDKNARAVPDLEQTFLSIITASRGCASGQRIAAELIPRYAAHCPTALEAATRVAVNMYNWNFSLVLRGDDADGIAFQTAAACIFGLAQISCTASSVEATSSVLGGICSAVFINILTFFISSFEGKNICDISDEEIDSLQACKDSFSKLKRKLESSDGSPSSKLFRFRVLSLLWIFFSCPKNVLQACFKLVHLNTIEVDSRKGGTYFLKQITSSLPCNELSLVNAGIHDSEVSPSASDENLRKMSALSNCLLGKAVSKDPSLIGWAFSRYKKLCESNTSHVHSEISSSFLKLFKSFQDVNQEADAVEMRKPDLLKCGNQEQICKHAGGFDSTIEKSGLNYRTRINQSASVVSCECGRQDDNFQGQSVESTISVIKSRSDSQSTNDNSNIDREGSVSMRSTGTPEGRPSMRQEMRTSSLGSSNILVSPRYSSSQQNSGPASQIVWYSDGHSASMDVFPASKQLWLGSLGHDVSENSIRCLCEKYGPLANFVHHPGRGFSLVEYRHIMDAIKARESMQGSSPWGSGIRVKFLDVGLGSKGSVNGTAIGSSCHVYVGNVSSQRVKETILHGLRGAGFKPSRAVTNLTSENALLLEFDSAEEAALVMTHIRLQRQENGYRSLSTRRGVPQLSSLFESLCSKYNIGHLSKNRPSMVPREDDRAATNILSISMQNIAGPYISDDDVMSICKLALENVGSVLRLTRAHMHGGLCWFVEFNSKDAAIIAVKNMCACPNMLFNIEFRDSVNIMSNDKHDPRLERPYMKHHPASYSSQSEVNMPELVSPSKRADNRGPFIQGQPVNMMHEQNWMHKRPDIQLQNSVSGPNTCPGGSLIPPPIQTPPPFIQPLYAPRNSWNPMQVPTSSPHMNHVRPSVIPTSHPINSYPLRPYAPSVTPLAQIAANSTQPFGVAPPIVPPVSSPPPPPPDMPPPLPPSPPPPPPDVSPPMSQTPVPPPPSCPSPPSEQAVALPKSESRERLHCQWQGTLCKSGVQYCTVIAKRENSDLCQYSNGQVEPSNWPAKLDVTKRTDFRHVKSTFANTPPHKREVCRLLPNSNGHQKGFQDFVSYLKQKECAGVIKIPAGTSMWPRLLFILPHSLDLCSLLSISVEPAESLIAVVLPKETNFDWL